MRKSNINVYKAFKVVLIVYVIFFLAGTVASFFGINLDINFSGGTRISYSYTGEINDDEITKVVDEKLDANFSISKSTALAGDTKTFEIVLAGKKSVSAETQEALTKALAEKFKDNKVELYNSNSVSPTVAGTFFAKSIVAVILTAIFVIIYVGIRFRKIGGVSAAITALCAIVLDVFVTFFICVIFRLQIDSNYIAVVLTILGYSLNDTIVIYDRVRELSRRSNDKGISEIVNDSINQCMVRNIVTSVTTFLAIMTIVVVSELYGLISLRTFAIPMAFGIISGAVTSLFIAGPLWVIWKNWDKKRKEQKKVV
ncbi:MAG: protein translocase subunit SecF [Acutalibacteraceae bacterium]|jgi:preprotein translocase subunit SecF